MGQTLSGVGVLDKSVAVLEAVETATRAERACGLGELTESTGLPRATAHRLASALAAHGILARDDEGAFTLGARLIGLGHAAVGAWPVAEIARPILTDLCRRTGESVQLYVREGDQRVCLVSIESPHELRTIVAEGARLPLSVGSAGRLLAGYQPTEGWTASVEERAPGVASVSAPVRNAGGSIIAAIGISGPVGRLGVEPGAVFGDDVSRAGAAVERELLSRR
ncbi:MAG: IclR family transcriptional regulator [Acidimicrobiales bacterium]|nr:IclR family transcriptional regulator [Acidimicrobiales bacterium]